jgi:hypothetical protein
VTAPDFSPSYEPAPASLMRPVLARSSGKRPGLSHIFVIRICNGALPSRTSLPEINILIYSLSRRVRVTCRALLRSVGRVCVCSKNRTWNFSISHACRPMNCRRVAGR